MVCSETHRNVQCLTPNLANKNHALNSILGAAFGGMVDVFLLVLD